MIAIVLPIPYIQHLLDINKQLMYENGKTMAIMSDHWFTAYCQILQLPTIKVQLTGDFVLCHDV